ncbi:MAG: DUF2726 domain-containing protein, partial [Pseudomonadota bacterium]
MLSIVPFLSRRHSPFQRVLSPVPPLRTKLRIAPSRLPKPRVSSADIIDTVAIDVAPLMDRSRNDWFHSLSELAHDRGLDVAPEVSLGALFKLRSPEDQPDLGDATKVLRGKRVDFVIFDRFANAVLAIDHRGDGPWRGRALRRDRLKRRVFEKAGIPLVEVGGTDDWSQDRAHLIQLLDQVSAEAPSAPSECAA